MTIGSIPAERPPDGAPGAVPRADGAPSAPTHLVGRRWPVLALAFALTIGVVTGLNLISRPDEAARGDALANGTAHTVAQLAASVAVPTASPSLGPTDAAECSDRPIEQTSSEGSGDGPAESPDPPAALGGPTPTSSIAAAYAFDGSLASSVVPAPDLVQFRSSQHRFVETMVFGLPRTELRFGAGQGLSLAPATSVIDGERYTIELLFRLHDLRSWRKIVDFAGDRVDIGLYSLNGCLNFYPRVTAPAVSLERDTYVHVVLTREEDAIVTGYVDGVRQFAFLDSDDEATIDADDPLVFFRDDRETRQEQSGGAVSLIRIFDRALTESEVAFLACAASAKDGCRG